MIGWPNHPGRPELLAHSRFSDGFKLTIKLHSPDHLGGIAPDQLMCDVYVADVLDHSSDLIHATNVAINSTVDIELSPKALIYDGVHSVLNIYYLYVQLKAGAELSQNTIFALPTGSSILELRTDCDLIG